MNAIDTSLLYAAFNAKDKWHIDGREALAERRPLLVPPGILQETLDLLGRRHGPAIAAAALQWLARQPRIVIEPGQGDESHQAALDAILAQRVGLERLSFADVWCVAHARRHGAGLLTRDKAQLAAYQAWETA